MIFHPTNEIVRTPRDVGLVYQDLYLTSADNVRLNGWFIPHPQASATMIWLLGSRHDSRAVILESPFASIRAVAKVMLPALPLSPLLSAKFDVIDKVEKIAAPLLVLHGDQDEIVPFEQGQRVFAAAPNPSSFIRSRARAITTPSSPAAMATTSG